MKTRLLFVMAAVGVLLGVAAAFYSNEKKPAESPVFSPAPNPYARGIYANGIVESYQTHGENINIYPEVGGTVTQILVAEGETVKAGTPLMQLDDTIQQGTVEQLRSQADAALAMLEELKAQPRKEVLAVSRSQREAAQASVKNAQDQFNKIKYAYALNPRSMSKNDFDNALNALTLAKRNQQVAARQFELTRAGAWSFEIRNQERQYHALLKQWEAARALLGKYTLRAPSDGAILSIKSAVGSFVSPQGVYGSYTEGLGPILVMGANEKWLQVRTYVDEILIQKLPAPEKMSGQMFVRGTDVSVSLQYVRTQPYVSPKIELSDQRQERVDVRVLPLIFKFEKPPSLTLYPGQLVDVYIGEQVVAQLPGTAASAAQAAP